LAIAGAKKRFKFSTRVSSRSLHFVGLNTHGADFKKILNDLIEEDFTNRTFENVKAMLTLVSTPPFNFLDVQAFRGEPGRR